MRALSNSVTVIVCSVALASLALAASKETVRAAGGGSSTTRSRATGSPSHGKLVNGVQMPDGEGWIVRNPTVAWGTQETIDTLIRVITKVHRQYPDAHPLCIGSISREHGGPFPPHKSHQNGRDVDLGFYYTIDQPCFARATDMNFDAELNWALVKTLVDDGNVAVMLIDSEVQRKIRDYASGIGEDTRYLARIFGADIYLNRGLVRHVPGHDTHIHVRFKVR